MPRAIALLFLFVALMPVLGVQPPAPAIPRGSRLAIRIDPFVTLHFLARKAAAGEGPAPAIDGFDRVIAALRELNESLGGPRGWQQFEGNIARCSSASEAKEVLGGLPVTVSIGGRAAPLREPAVRYAEALAGVETAYLRDLWPTQREALQKAGTELKTRLGPHEKACLDDVLTSLNMADPGVEISVYLVMTAPRPGASTVPMRGGGAVCFVACDDSSPSQFLESVLHESIHALDIATSAQDTALNQLRKRLRDAGMPATDPRLRDFWHTIMFIQAGETIRRVVDPAHEHYGDTAGYYDKVSKIASLERPIWTDYLDKKLTLDEALAKIVAGVPATEPKP